jgi:hypothetical protein
VAQIGDAIDRHVVHNARSLLIGVSLVLKRL